MQKKQHYVQTLKWLLPSVGMTTLGCMQTPQGLDKPLMVPSSFATAGDTGSPRPSATALLTMPTYDWLGDLAAPTPTTTTLLRESPSRNHTPPVSHSYEANGHRYGVFASARGYVRQGLATWYGKDFHGKATASGETYDMHALSAAHRSLPLDSCLLVVNKENNRRVVVKVNDRGPFSQPFFLDLSYEAARRLQMVEQGTALVEARAIGQHTCRLLAKRMRNGEEMPQRTARRSRPAGESVRLVQVGAFHEHHRAKELLDTIRALGYSGFIRPDRGIDASTVYRIMLGLPNVKDTWQPLSLAQQLIAAAAQLNRYQ